VLRQLTPRQRDWLDRATALREEQLAPNARRVDESGQFPRENFDAIRKSGLFSIGVPEEMGGAGVDHVGVALVCEELSRGCASTAMSFAMHVNSWWPWAALATPEQARAYVEPGVTKQVLATHANTERATGSQFWNYTSAAEKTPEGWRLNAEKAFVTSAGEADAYWFTSRPSADAPLNAATLFYVDAAEGGWRITDEWRGMGLRGQRSARMVFENIQVADQAAFCPDGSLLEVGFQPIIEAACSTLVPNFLGMSQALVDHTRKHVKNRVHQNTGKRLSENDMVQERVGAMQTRVDAARALVYSALEFAARVNDVQQAMVPLLQTKSIVASTCTEIAQEALHACGAVAYRGDTEVSRCYRDAVAAPIMVPTQDWCNIFVGRALLEEPLFG
jgi:alkylation response protein AidB-like acyl-CoA dehydrogenase